ncbi:hypothetical protein AB6B38_13805 [Glycocaulis abyssi]|uniref:Growth inhibitor PemK n=1 Tax=Glycocaulis abyssi TaxID=1433403 RepID=A0ABV9NAQ2_9PROT
MKKPEPVPGLVIRYDFLWSHEREKGRNEGSKDRPCVVVAAIIRSADGKTEVLLVPVTHSPPAAQTGAIPIPAAVSKHLGLDDGHSYIVTAEANAVSWDDAGIVPARPGEAWTYGRLPKSLFEAIRSAMMERLRQRTLKSAKRQG